MSSAGDHDGSHHTPTTNMRKLSWKSQVGAQVASDDRCLYMREGMGSIIGAAIFSMAIVGSAGYLGVSILVTPCSLVEKAFGVFMLLVAAVFVYIPWVTLRRGRWMVVYDRGVPGTPGEIRCQGKSLPVASVRSLSTRFCGGSMPRSTVVAELHDGTYVSLGPVCGATWPAHYAQQAAAWLGLPYRQSNDGYVKG